MAFLLAVFWSLQGRKKNLDPEALSSNIPFQRLVIDGERLIAVVGPQWSALEGNERQEGLKAACAKLVSYHVFLIALNDGYGMPIGVFDCRKAQGSFAR